MAVGEIVMPSPADRDQITALVQRYAQLVDRREISAVVELFAEDAVLVLPEPPTHLGPVRRCTGRDEIAQALRVVREIPVTLHGILGLVVDGDGNDGAIGSVTGVAHHLTDRPDGTTVDLVWYLHYADTYRHHDGRWLFARRSVDIDWIEARPVSRRRAEREPND